MNFHIAVVTNARAAEQRMPANVGWRDAQRNCRLIDRPKGSLYKRLLGRSYKMQSWPMPGGHPATGEHRTRIQCMVNHSRTDASPTCSVATKPLCVDLDGTLLRTHILTGVASAVLGPRLTAMERAGRPSGDISQSGG
jgi:hypothetical protein